MWCKKYFQNVLMHIRKNQHVFMLNLSGAQNQNLEPHRKEERQLSRWARFLAAEGRAARKAAGRWASTGVHVGAVFFSTENETFNLINLANHVKPSNPYNSGAQTNFAKKSRSLIFIWFAFFVVGNWNLMDTNSTRLTFLEEKYVRNISYCKQKTK